MSGKIQNPFVKASTKKKYLKIAVYGPPGVGKTYFGLGFPSPAVIDLEGGTDFYADRFQFSVLDTKSFAEVLNAVEFLETGHHDFKTIVIDPITVIWSALQDGRLEFKTQNIDKAVSGEEKAFFSYQDWGQIKRFYSMLMTKLVNLPMHVVMAGRQKDEYEIKKNGDMTKIGVKIEAEKSTPYLPDICFRLEVDERSGQRVGIFEKDRSGHFPKGSRVGGISFETFRPLIEEISKGTQQATHQKEEDAGAKDAEFFQQEEQPRQQSQAQPQGQRPTGNGKEAALRMQINALLRSYYREDEGRIAEYLIKELPEGKGGLDEMTADELTVMKGNIKVLMEAGNGSRQTIIN